MTLQKKQMPRKSLASVADKPDSSLPASAPVKTKKKTGRPSTYTPELGERICEQMVSGKSVRTICKAEDMPAPRTIFSWLVSNQEFMQQYAHARNVQAELIADEIVEIADDGSNDTYFTTDRDGNAVEKVNQDVINRSRLRVDARKWVASKLLPKKYGDRIEVELDDKREDPGKRLEELLARATARTS